MNVAFADEVNFEAARARGLDQVLGFELSGTKRDDNTVDEHLFAAVENFSELLHDAVSKQMADQLVLQLATQLVVEAVGLNQFTVIAMRFKLNLSDLAVESMLELRSLPGGLH